MNKLHVLDPAFFTTPKGEELVLLTLTRTQWEVLRTVLSESDLIEINHSKETNYSEAEKMRTWQEDNLLELAERLDGLEIENSPQEKLAWQEAVSKAQPAHYIPGQGIVVEK